MARKLAAISSPVGLVLAFHNVIPDGATARGDRSLHLPFAAFCEILDWLCEEFAVVPLDQVDLRNAGSEPLPKAAITFDDAYAGALSLALPELSRRGLSATVFVVSGAVAGQTFWWDALADALPDGMPRRMREDALLIGRGRQDEVLEWAAEQGHPVVDLDGAFVAAAWSDIGHAATHPGVSIASHTRTHANLSVLPERELVDELSGSLQELNERIPQASPWLAYPYGLYNSDVEKAAAEAGYEFAFRVNGGVVLRGDQISSNFALPRLSIPAGLSQRGFRIRAAGLLGR